MKDLEIEVLKYLLEVDKASYDMLLERFGFKNLVPVLKVLEDEGYIQHTEEYSEGMRLFWSITPEGRLSLEEFKKSLTGGATRKKDQVLALLKQGMSTKDIYKLTGASKHYVYTLKRQFKKELRRWKSKR